VPRLVVESNALAGHGCSNGEQRVANSKGI
jgi:hypothetical protein